MLRGLELLAPFLGIWTPVLVYDLFRLSDERLLLLVVMLRFGTRRFYAHYLVTVFRGLELPVPSVCIWMLELISVWFLLPSGPLLLLVGLLEPGIRRFYAHCLVTVIRDLELLVPFLCIWIQVLVSVWFLLPDERLLLLIVIQGPGIPQFCPYLLLAVFEVSNCGLLKADFGGV